MAKTEKVTFKNPVYKDQTVVADYGKIIAVGDTLFVQCPGDGGADAATAVQLVLTHVSNNGRTVGWDQNSAIGKNYRSSDIGRVHKKHQKVCTGVLNYQTAAIAGPINGFTMNGIAHTLASTTVTALNAPILEDLIDAYLQGNGYCVVTFDATPTPDTFVIRIYGTSYVPNSVLNLATPALFTTF